MYLVEFSKVGTLIIEDDGIYAVPEFLDLLQTKNMGEKAMRCVALAHDYLSPYRHRPAEDRPEFVSRDVYKGSKQPFKNDNPKFRAAIKKYQTLQFDPYREELKATSNIIQQSIILKNALPVTNDNLLTISGLISRIESFESRYDKLRKKIEEEGSAGPVKDKISLYRLEAKYKEEQELNQ